MRSAISLIGRRFFPPYYFVALYHQIFNFIRPDAPPLIIVSGDREMEMLGRYEENAYFWRMMKVAGHKNTYIYELDGYDHGSMAAPAFHILKNHVNAILKGSETR